MKKIVVAFLIGISSLSYAQQTLHTLTVKESGFTGNVKSIVEKQLLINPDSSRYEVPSAYAEYNEEGYQLLNKSKTKHADNTFTKKINTYDDFKNLVEVKEYEDTLFVCTRIYEYDSLNRKTKELVYGQDSLQREKTLYTYDESGHLIEEVVWGLGDSLVVKKTYEYDKNGNQLSQKSYNEKNVLNYEYLYRYDDRNNKIEQQYRNSVVRTDNYVYNEKNQLINMSVYLNDLLLHEIDYTYDQNGVNTETVERIPTGPLRIISRHNEKGLIIEAIQYRNNELVISHTWWYEYDACGNWTKCYVSYNGKMSSFTERAFEYY